MHTGKALYQLSHVLLAHCFKAQRGEAASSEKQLQHDNQSWRIGPSNQVPPTATLRDLFCPRSYNPTEAALQKGMPCLSWASFYDIMGWMSGASVDSPPTMWGGMSGLGMVMKASDWFPVQLLAASGNPVQASVNLWRAGLNYSIHK